MGLRNADSVETAVFDARGSRYMPHGFGVFARLNMGLDDAKAIAEAALKAGGGKLLSEIGGAIADPKWSAGEDARWHYAQRGSRIAELLDGCDGVDMRIYGVHMRQLSDVTLAVSAAYSGWATAARVVAGGCGLSGD